VHVVPRALDTRWEGAVRPGHFAGVLTVVAKLFNMVQPDVAVFGQKDVQQLTIVRAMVRDLDFPIEILAAAIAREPDGLAMSSRNTYLGGDERVRALSLSRALRAVSAAFVGGDRATATLEALGRQTLAEAAGVEVDYLAVVDAHTLEPKTVASAGDVVIVAARVGRTRLIDNLVLGAA
jgi:pantoate--beta-alanine ligase